MLKKIIKRFIRYCIGILKPFERSSTYVGQNLVLTKTIWGHKMYVSSHDLSLSPHLIIDGYWEEWITKQFRKICKPDMTVLDVGSNLGYYSLHAAELVGSSGRVHSFEANPNLHKIIFKNMAINGYLGRTTLYNNAVSDKSDKIIFNCLKNHLGSSSVASFSEDFLELYMDEVEQIEVEAIALDEIPDLIKSKIDIIKIDAEGSEPLIWNGMQKILKKNPLIKIIAEFSPASISGIGENPRDFLDRIIGMGFQIKSIQPDGELIEVNIDQLVETNWAELLLSRD